MVESPPNYCLFHGCLFFLSTFIGQSAGWPVRSGLTSLNRRGGFCQEFQQCLTGGHSLPLTKLASLLHVVWPTADDPIESDDQSGPNRDTWPILTLYWSNNQTLTCPYVRSQGTSELVGTLSYIQCKHQTYPSRWCTGSMHG